MPIMNGFEACKKLRQLHGDSNEGGNILHDLVRIDRKTLCASVHDLNMNQDEPIRPLIIAFSALISDSIAQ
jgi:CheY-like chemotaxis protein